MLQRLLLIFVGVYLAGATCWVLWSARVRDNGSTIQLLNAACDPTRELWREINTRFAEHMQRDRGETVAIRQSHGGSSSQARAVIDGLDADVVTLALWSDTNAIHKAGLIEESWEDHLPNRSLPFVSTIVFVVRKGNPKGIKDWPDLAKPDVKVITPNPKTSGNGKWSLLAAYGSVILRGGSEADAEHFQIRESAQKLIAFKQINLLDPWKMNGPFDVIFCRNVFIYFTQETVREITLRFAELLKTGGLLCIGHSENLLNMGDIFAHEGKTIYRKVGHGK